MISRICDTMRGISPSVGSSSRMILGSSIIARAIASICCSPPDKRAAGLVAPLGEHREKGVDLVQQLLLLRLADAVAVEAGAQVLEHRQQPEDAAVLRHIADPEPRQPMRRAAGDRPAVEQRPGRRSDARGRRSPSGRALADAVAARAGRPPRRCRPRARCRAGYGSCRNRCGCPRPEQRVMRRSGNPLPWRGGTGGATGR